VLIDTPAETQVAGLNATDNGGVGALVLQGSATISAFQIANTRVDLSVGPGDGVVSSFGGHVTLTNGRSDDNAGSGISVQSGSSGIIDGVSATGNGGWGLDQACGNSTVEVNGEARFDNNDIGAMRACP
jgi:hypothetical protein